MPKIAVFTTTEELYETAGRVARNFSSELILYRVTAATATEAAKQAEQSGCQAIVIRRALSGPVKRAAITIPVIECALMQGEILAVMWEAKEKTGMEKPHICFLSSEREVDKTMLAIQLFQRLLQTKISFYDVEADIPQTIYNAVERAKEDAVDIFVASATIDAQLRGCGVPTQRLSGAHADESIFNAIRMAELVLKALELERSHSRDLMTIVQHSFDAMVYIDQRGSVILMNAAAQSMLAATEGIIWEMVPQLEQELICGVLYSGEEVFGKIIEQGDMVYITNITAVRGDGGIEGAILQFNELERIQQMEAHAKNELNRKGHFARYSFDDLIGNSPVLLETRYIAMEFAKHDSTILLLGESGTGKELFAQSIHQASARRNQPFVAVNCAALPLSLLESELFGYSEGAFTGAVRRGKRGLFEMADTGTIFLDEISELDLAGQVRLLRVLAEKRVRRVGDEAVIPTDVRVIAATNRDLAALVRQGAFREDLYYRLNVLTVQIPPLRERREDIAVLIRHYLAMFGRKTGKYIALSDEAIAVMQEYTWRGNVRQLRNFCERLAIISRSKVLDAVFIRAQLRAAYGREMDGELVSLPLDSVAALEQRQIQELLKKHRHLRRKVAEELGISKSTLYRKMKRYGLLDAENR